MGTIISKKRTRRSTKTLQSLPISSSLTREPLNDLDITASKAGTNKEAFAGVMDILIDISSHHEAKEQGTEKLRAAKDDAPERVQSVCATKDHHDEPAEDTGVTDLSVILLLITLLHQPWQTWLNQ